MAKRRMRVHTGDARLAGTINEDLLKHELMMTAKTNNFSSLRKHKQLMALITRGSMLGLEEIRNADSSSKVGPSADSEGGARKMKSVRSFIVQDGQDAQSRSAGSNPRFAKTSGVEQSDAAPMGSSGRRNSMGTFSGPRSIAAVHNVVQMFKTLKQRID